MTDSLLYELAKGSLNELSEEQIAHAMQLISEHRRVEAIDYINKNTSNECGLKSAACAVDYLTDNPWPKEEQTAPKKMYVLVNRRLERVYASVQGGHALAQWIFEHPYQDWNNTTLIYLRCRLDKKIDEMVEHGYDFSVFKEPDFNNTITAVACYGDDDMLFTRLQTL